MSELAEKPDPLATRELERRHGTANLFLLEGRARLTPEFVATARSHQPSARTEPKLALAIATWARTHPVIVAPTTSPVIDLGTSQHCACTPLAAAR